MAPNNPLSVWGNDKTMNLNSLVLTNIQSSPYFKVQLFELKTFHEVVDEIYYRVEHLEPWEKGSRKTSGQTGMCGGVRGVGAGGIVSSAYCLLYKLFTLKLTRKQVNNLISHSDSPYIRGLGFMYIRYTQQPGDLWDWYEPYLNDEEELDVKAGGGHVMTIGEMLRQWLVKLEWYSTLFPRIPVPIQKDIAMKLRSGTGYQSYGNRVVEQEPEHIPDDQVSYGEAERAALSQRWDSRDGAHSRDSRDGRGGAQSRGSSSRCSPPRRRSPSFRRSPHRSLPRSDEFSRELEREKERQRRERDPGHKRSKHDKRSKRRTRSRSNDKRRSWSRDRKRSLSTERKRSRSHSKERRSLSGERKRSVSNEKKISRSHSKDTKASTSQYRDKQMSRSRSRDRKRARSKSPDFKRMRSESSERTGRQSRERYGATRTEPNSRDRQVSSTPEATGSGFRDRPRSDSTDERPPAASHYIKEYKRAEKKKHKSKKKRKERERE